MIFPRCLKKFLNKCMVLSWHDVHNENKRKLLCKLSYSFMVKQISNHKGF